MARNCLSLAKKFSIRWRALEVAIIGPRRAAIGLWRDDDGLAGCGQRLDDPLVGIKGLIGDQRLGLYVRQQVIGADEVMRLAAGQMKADRVAEGIDEGVDFGAQAAARAADGLVFARMFSGAGAVLMGAHDGAVDHRILGVSVPGQALKNPLPDTGFSPAAEAAMDVLAVAKALRQVAPGDAGAIAVENGIDEQAVVRGGPTNRPRPAGQQISDPLRLVVTKGISAHRSASSKLTAYESKNRRRWNRGTACPPTILPHCCSADSLGWPELTTRPNDRWP